MKISTPKKSISLKSIEKEFKTILEDDIRKFTATAIYQSQICSFFATDRCLKMKIISNNEFLISNAEVLQFINQHSLFDIGYVYTLFHPFHIVAGAGIHFNFITLVYK